MASIRQEKVSSLLKREIANYFQTNGKHLSLGTMITITMVRISPDLGDAKVYLSIFPSDKVEDVIDHINRYSNEVRHNLAGKLRHSLRKLPEVRFFVDDSLDYAERIDSLLKD